MHSRLLLGITILAFTAAGCAGGSANPAFAGGTAPAVDAAPVVTLSGAAVTSAHSGVPVTGRNWNCPSCYK